MIYQFICVLVIIITLFACALILYEKKGWFKTFFHDSGELHIPNENGNKFFDGRYVHTTCKYCGKDLYQHEDGVWVAD